MKDDDKLGPCGKVCETCLEECPITVAQWNLWLSVDMLDPKSKDDAMTRARKFSYMKYSGDEYNPDAANDWVEALLHSKWKESRRDDFVYRYPIPRDKLRSFIDDILKTHLSRRERQVVTVHLGLDTGKRLTFIQMRVLFNIDSDKLGIIYRGALDKLKKAIKKDLRWRRRGPDGRYTAI